MSGPSLHFTKAREALDAADQIIRFFSERLNIGLDVFLSGPTPPERIRESLRKSILLAGRV
jgi:hypothetical protein